MKDLLFLIHRIPYPPNKGDKIRSFNFLKALSSEYNIHLGAFVDDPEDWQYTAKVDALCTQTHFVKLQPRQAKIKSLQGFFSRQALSLPYYRNAKMQDWVNQVISEHKPSKALIYSSVMAQFIDEQHDLPMIADFVDVDSDKWQQYAEHKKWPMNWVYRREAKRLLAHEQRIASKAKMTVFVSEHESQLFQQLAPESKAKITFLKNGVDTQFFAPEYKGESPYPNDEKVIVFTGAMNYWANVNAVSWFVEQVMPLIKQQISDAKFYIVGSKPTTEVQALAGQDDIHVTGAVIDIRPYIAHATISVAPLKIARGIQNKVLEAMAMDIPVVATPEGMEGICINDSLDVWIKDEPEAFAQQICQSLNTKTHQQSSGQNRAFVKKHFSWESSGKKLLGLLE